MPVTSPVQLTKIKTEFQGGNNFSGYVRNGSYVPTNGTTGSISTTVAGLAMSQFLNAQKSSPPSISPSPNPASGYTQGGQFNMPCGRVVNLNPSGGNGSYTYNVAYVSNTGGSSPNCTTNTTSNTATLWLTLSAPPGSSASGTVVYDITVVSNGVTGNTVRVTAILEYYHEDDSCVVTYSFVTLDDRAGDVELGDTLRVTDPWLEGEPNTVDGEVLQSQRAWVPCVKIITSSGAWLECSTTAPIPTVNGYVKAPYLKGEKIPVAAAEQLVQDQIEFEWEEVVDVQEIGEREVQNLFVAHRCFWASGDGKRFILHHNGKVIR